MTRFACLTWVLLGLGCRVSPPAGDLQQNPLLKIIRSDKDLAAPLAQPELFEVQIIYTQIDRDKKQRPHFTTFRWNVDSSRYFYPASMVKLPLALLALEKVNHLRKQPHLSWLKKETPYRIDSLLPAQVSYRHDPGAPEKTPSVAHDIRQILTVSDNAAYNHLFEFLGREHINRALKDKGYRRTGILHRFNAGSRNNAVSSPFTFRGPGGAEWTQSSREDTTAYPNPQEGLLKGKGYLNAHDSLIQEPFDFSTRNWFALTDMERMLRAVIFPNHSPQSARFDLSPDDYRFLHHYMGIFPRECDFPTYDSTHHDGYVKFLVMGDSTRKQSGKIRSFNKVGAAYGTLTDVAYITDFEHGVEFILAATLLCNSDGVYNDDRYDYEEMGLPFLAKLGRAILAYERQRPRAHRPVLKYWETSTQ
jgi:hypothetical protein